MMGVVLLRVHLKHTARGRAASISLGVRVKLDFLEKAALAIGIPHGALPRVRAGEDRHLAAAVVVEPLDAPFSGVYPILENLG